MDEKIKSTTGPETITVETTRFGPVQAPANEVVTLVEDMLGFPGLRRYVFLDNPAGGPFKWMQSLDLPQVAFVVCDPALFLPSYKVLLKQSEMDEIQLQKLDEGVVVVILVVPKDPRGITANLQGPLVINLEKRLAKQFILSGTDYPTRYPIFAGGEG